MKILSGLALFALFVLPVRAEIIEQVLVKVNGDIITKTDLEQRQIAALRERANKQVDAEALKTDEGLRKALAEITPALLVEAIDELLLVQLGREKGYRLSDDQFKEWLQGMRKEQNLLDDERFALALKQEGMTLEDLRKNVERRFLIQQVQRDEVGSKLSITEEEARQYYLSHKDQFVEPANVTLREILIEVPTTTQGGVAGVNVAQDDEAKAKAEAVRARLAAGEDFAKVASEVSVAASKANGGLIGPINIAELSDTLQQAIQKMKPGDVSQPMRVAKGFHIFKLETVKPAVTPPFEQVRDLVADRVHEDRQRTEVAKFLARMRGQALIEWKNEDLKKAYERQIAASTPGAAAND